MLLDYRPHCSWLMRLGLPFACRFKDVIAANCLSLPKLEVALFDVCFTVDLLKVMKLSFLCLVGRRDLMIGNVENKDAKKIERTQEWRRGKTKLAGRNGILWCAAAIKNWKGAKKWKKCSNRAYVRKWKLFERWSCINWRATIPLQIQKGSHTNTHTGVYIQAFVRYTLSWIAVATKCILYYHVPCTFQ